MDNISINDRYEKFVTFDEPIPYWSHNIKNGDRNGGNCLYFHPIMIRDMYEFYRYCGCLMTDHSSVLDKSLPFDEAMKVLSMTCYEYLWRETFQEGKSGIYIYMFNLLLALCLKRDEFKNLEYDKFENMYLKPKTSLSKPAFMIDDILYDSEDFDNIKELIGYQNDLELPDIVKDKRFRDKVAQAKKDKARILGSGDKMGGLEDQLICLSLGYGLSYNDVGKVSIRKFNKMIEYMNKKMHYEIYMTAALSGFVEFKDKSVLKHWMVAEEKDRYSDVLMDTDEVDAKINGNKST